ncbi:MAG: GatB/YqeY domain-containing protein [Acidobacteriota bacterium]|nr:GatB/YqeY domain-containing protein [Acidobacteriota bacterium]
MSLKENIIEDMKTAMRAKEKERLSVLRMVKSAIMNKEIEKGGELEDEEVVKMLNTLVKQRRDSADQYIKAGRPELAEAELSEIVVIENYMPASATTEEIQTAVDEAVTESGASTMKDMGGVMKLALSKLSGKTVDGKTVSEAVRSKLQEA